MNCNHCTSNIPEGMNVDWNGGKYHPGCIGEAVLQHRAEKEKEIPDFVQEAQESREISLEDFSDDFEEDFDQLEENETLEELEGQPIIPEIVSEQQPLVMPAGAIIAAPRAVIFQPGNGVPNVPVSNGVSKVSTGTLIAGKDTRFVSREFLETIAVPESTDTFKPIGHAKFIEQIMDSLWYRRMNVVHEEYAVSTDGMKMFGLIELDIEYKGVKFAIGVRNANDKSMRVAMVAGYKVTVCSNMMLQGDFQPMLAKHSKNFDLQDALSIACDRVQRNFGRLHNEITAKQEKQISASYARELCYKAFTDGKFPISLLRTVHSEYFEKPSYEEFSEPTLWSLENAFTTAFKKLEPVAQFQATAKLGKFLAAI